MTYLASIAASAALLLNFNVAHSHAAQAIPVENQGQPSTEQQPQQDPHVVVMPSAASSVPATLPAPPALPVKDENSRLSPETRLELIRYVSGEFARVTTTLPGKKGIRVRVGQPIDRKVLLEALEENGAAVNAGDNVQITKLEFGGSEITVEINGGGKGPSWRERIQISGVGGAMPVSTQTTVQDYGAVAPTVNPGTSVVLDFQRPLPEMTPEELKQYLGVVFDFSNQRSAAVQWTESLPPAIREAIAQKRAEVGMDADQVIAALGRPERKVRERQPDGLETEDWIYGQPPGKTIFVRFTEDKVIRVSQYP